MDVQAALRRQVLGRAAAHSQGRGLHLQLHHPEPGGQLHALHAVHQPRGGARRHHRGHLLRQAQGQHAQPLDPDPARAHLEERQRQGLHQLPDAQDDLRQRPLLHGRAPGGQVREDGSEPVLLARQAHRRRDRLRELPEPGHHGPGSQVRCAAGRLEHPRGDLPPDGYTARPHHHVPDHRLRRAGVQLLHGSVAGQPGVPGPGLPQRPQLGRGPERDRQQRLPGVCGAGRYGVHGRLLPQGIDRLALGAAGRREVRL